jgi:phosphate:Na+ symporter
VFAGISMLQLAMEGFSDVVTPQSLPPNTILGRFLLVLIGVAITLVTQSSSAGVATAITAVHVGTISLPQAAAMVIGMNVGTTFTAAMAAIGGTVNARRTGFAHVIYNLMTGVGAFLCMTLFIDGWDAFAPRSVRSDPEIALVSFHTLFNGLGVLLVLPFTRQFARLIERLVPAHEHELTRRLDQSLLDDPNVAIDSVEATLRELASVVFQVLAGHLSITGQAAKSDWRLDEVQQAVDETRVYLSQMKGLDINDGSSLKRASALHLLDHLGRLIRRCRMTERFRHVRSDQELREIGNRLATAIVADTEASEDMTLLNTNLERLWSRIDDRIEPFRRETIQRSTRGSLTTEQTISRLDAIRWLRRVCYHAWRIAYHLDPKIRSELMQETELTIEGEPEDLGS